MTLPEGQGRKKGRNQAVKKGNYVLAYLDDAYYVKYRLAGKVQLPLGRVVQMTASKRGYAEVHLAEYVPYQLFVQSIW